jgi:hypothetical protein
MLLPPYSAAAVPSAEELKYIEIFRRAVLPLPQFKAGGDGGGGGRDNTDDAAEYEDQLKVLYARFKKYMVQGGRVNPLSAGQAHRLVYAADSANGVSSSTVVSLGNPMRQDRPVWTLSTIAPLLASGQISADMRMALVAQFEKVGHFFAQRAEADRATVQFLRCYLSVPSSKWDEVVNPGDGRNAFTVENIPLLRLWQDLSGTNLWVGMGHVYGLVDFAALPMFPTPFLPYVSDPKHTTMRLSVVQHGLALAFAFAAVPLHLRHTSHGDRCMCHTCVNG